MYCKFLDSNKLMLNEKIIKKLYMVSSKQVNALESLTVNHSKGDKLPGGLLKNLLFSKRTSILDS